MVSVIEWWRQESPIGSIVIGTIGGRVCLVDWEDASDPNEILHPLHQFRVVRDDSIAVVVDRYFGGEVGALVGLEVDLRLARTDFRRQVLTALRELPANSLTTYGDLAAKVGKPKGAQAVGGAVGSNPVPIVIPCHRVMSANGSLGGFSGGLATKRWLLSHEGHQVPEGGWIASHRYD
jgi:methylated-DNA-[protein]-cysteine S-methyltransferase